MRIIIPNSIYVNKIFLGHSHLPKIRFRILGKLTRRPKDKAAGDFATQPYCYPYEEEQNRRERSISGCIVNLNPDLVF